MQVQAWLMVCEPTEQTAQEIQDRLALSAGSVGTALRQLVAAGVLERVSRAGERRIFDRIASNSRDGPLQVKLRALPRMREVADRGIAAAGHDVDFRLTDMRDDAFTWFEHHLREHIAQRAINQPGDRPSTSAPWATEPGDVTTGPGLSASSWV